MVISKMKQGHAGSVYTSVAIALVLLLALAACSPNRIAYRGENLTERESGINVTSDADGNVIAVSSKRHHYSLVLPYSDKWDFSWKEGYLLIGSAGPVNVVLRATVTGDSPETHLKMLKGMLQRRGAVPGLESARMVKYRGDLVLVTVVDGAKATDSVALDGVKHLNVFSVRKWKNLLYRLNISTPFVKGKGERELRSEILDYATAGFSASYMRDHKSSDDDRIGVDSLWRRGGARRN
jgi:hypothetical protein